MAGLKGRGWLSFLGLAEESAGATYPAGAAASKYVPYHGDGVTSDENWFYPDVLANGPYFPLATAGRHDVKPGALTLHPDTNTLGLLLKWANRNLANSATTVGPAPTSPSATPAAGGSLTAGTYTYTIRTVFILTGWASGTAQSPYWMGNPTNTFTGTTAGSNLTLNLAWTPPTAPAGYTIYGYAVFRGAVGVPSPRYYLAYSSSASYNDTGGTALSTNAEPTVTINSHTNKGSLTNLQKTFAAEVCLDGFSKQLKGLKVADLALKIPARGAISASVTVDGGQVVDLGAPTSPTYSYFEPLMGHNALVYLGAYAAGTQQTTIVAQAHNFDFKLTNPLEKIEDCGSRFARDLREGERKVNATIGVHLEDSTYFDYVLNLTKLSCHVTCFSQRGLDGGTFSQVMNTKTVILWPQQLDIDMPQVQLQSQDAKTANKKQLTMSLPIQQLIYDTTAGYECSIVSVDTVSSYADVP